MGDTEDQRPYTSTDILGRTRQFYDRTADNYEALSFPTYADPARAAAVAAMDLSAGDTVVDMGVGTGANLPYLRDAVGEDGTVIGIDLSKGMLGYAENMIDATGWDNVRLVKGDAWNPPIRRSVDGITSTLVVEMFDRSDQLIEEWVGHVEDGAIAHIDVGYTDRAGSAAINRLIDAYCGLESEGWGEPFTREGGLTDLLTDQRPGKIISERTERAHKALERHATAMERGTARYGTVKWYAAQL